MVDAQTCDDSTNNVLKFSTFSIPVFLASISDTVILGLVFRREVFSSGDPWRWLWGTEGERGLGDQAPEMGPVSYQHVILHKFHL